jgi:hypothetical protein
VELVPGIGAGNWCRAGKPGKLEKGTDLFIEEAELAQLQVRIALNK